MIGYDLLVLAFTTGVVVTVNPCGFAMLPAYLSFFVGVDPDEDGGSSSRVGRALVVGGAVTAGFVGTFAIVGLVVSELTNRVYDVAPWLTIVVGIAMVGFGVALLAGRRVSLNAPRLDRGGRRRSVGSMVLFGVSYAVASTGCTLPLFVGTMSTMFGRSLLEGVQYFLAYAVGFGLVITALSVTSAIGERSLALGLRRVLPYVHRAAGGLLVVTGAYIGYYGWVEVRSGQGQGVPRGGAIDWVSGWSATASTWIQEQGGERIAIVLAAVVVGAGVLAAQARRSPPTAPHGGPHVDEAVATGSASPRV